jgi:hypothetical protein
MKKMTKFEKLGLEKKLLDTLDEAGFTTPFPIQERTIPVLLEGNDVIGQAHTELVRPLHMHFQYYRKQLQNKESREL